MASIYNDTPLSRFCYALLEIEEAGLRFSSGKLTAQDYKKQTNAHIEHAVSATEDMAFLVNSPRYGFAVDVLKTLANAIPPSIAIEIVRAKSDDEPQGGCMGDPDPVVVGAKVEDLYDTEPGCECWYCKGEPTPAQ